MHVNAYNFGQIDIDGRVYEHDVIITPDGVQADWWRKQGHNLCIEDLAGLMEHPPRVLVIGTGYGGCMRVPGKTIEELEARGIETHVENTREAVNIYNRLSQEGVSGLAAGLHLTC